MIAKTIACGEQFPRGYGFAWWNMLSRTGVCYPIPLNWLLRWVRDAYYFLARGPRRRQFDYATEAQLRQEFERGKKVGEDEMLRMLVHPLVFGKYEETELEKCLREVVRGKRHLKLV